MGGAARHGEAALTLVLDAGGASSLAGDRAKLAEIHRRGLWPPLVAAVVLTECLTGDHRRDHAVNRLVALCEVVAVDESLAREAARLRSATGRAARITAVDAVVAALADATEEATVLTTDPRDLRALAAVAQSNFRVVTV